MNLIIGLYKYSILVGLLSGVFWAVDTVFLGKAIQLSKIVSDSIIFVIIVAGIHDLISGLWVLFSIFMTKRTHLIYTALKNKDSWIICMAALAGGPIGMLGYLLSIKFSGAAIASILSTTYPAIGAFLAYLILKEKMGRLGLLGLFIIIISTIYLSLDSLTFSTNISVLGIIFGFICAFGWGIESTICSIALKNNIPYQVALLFRQLSSAIIYFIIVMVLYSYNDETKKILLSISPFFCVSLLVIAGFGALSYLMYYRAIDTLGPIKAMGLNISYSAWIVLLGINFGSNVSWLMLLLSVMIIIGSLLTNWKQKI